MRYIKSVLVGVAGALVAAVFWIVVSFLLPLFGQMFIDRILNSHAARAAVLAHDTHRLRANGFL